MSLDYTQNVFEKKFMNFDVNQKIYLNGKYLL
jgi:hypothetical protein